MRTSIKKSVSEAVKGWLIFGSVMVAVVVCLKVSWLLGAPVVNYYGNIAEPTAGQFISWFVIFMGWLGAVVWLVTEIGLRLGDLLERGSLRRDAFTWRRAG